MSDGVARLVESAYVSFTNYTLNVLSNGTDYLQPISDDGFYKVTATGYNKDVETGSYDILLANGKLFHTGWMKWDLSSLGSVDRVVFSITGSADQYGDYGFNTPAYFAIDDIAVRVYPE